MKKKTKAAILTSVASVLVVGVALEQVLLFLHIIGHNVRFRVIGSRFHKSTKTVHRYFKVVLRGVLKLYRALIRLPSENTPPKIWDSKRFYPFLKDCVGAIDGTHVRASVPPEIQERFRGHKDGTTQNVLAAISFDLKFTYVLAGWEDSAHDSRVLNHAFARPGGFSIPEGKYYLVDVGYGNKNGILSPYRSVRYHLKEFSDHPPENEQELFNLQHSSLRTTIKRGFGVLKKRFRVLDAEPFWSFETQGKVVLACCVIHNHIMGVDPADYIMEAAMNQEAAKGNKPSNTFKAGSFALVAKEISAQFGVECHPSYVEYRLRTLKTMWKDVQNLRKKSGFGWDDNLKMITCDAKTYQEEVMAHRKHADYLNKKIEMYDELAIVVGKDMATGSFAKSYVDIDTEQDNAESTEMVGDNGEEGVVDKWKNAVESSTTGSTLSKSRKRGRAPPSDDSAPTDLPDQLKEIAVALKEINREPVDYTSLYSEVMAKVADGYSEDMLATAFDHLCEKKKAAMGFLAKNAKLRKLWMDSFLFTQL
ncbi:hypothetical protein SO802_029526 [Lithocarpus litseifolius]|uniref:DDE Tnp4 domain-containing protein n=1 Tax=Lithocarpus litseifolius TaxID=425828 RepID=A0AAW2BVJ8_9ROSI